MIYLLIFVVWVAAIACALALCSLSTSTRCRGDCDQGRNCSCRETDDA